MHSTFSPVLDLEFRHGGGGAHKEPTELIDGKRSRKPAGFHASRSAARKLDRHVPRSRSAAEMRSCNIAVHGCSYVKTEEPSSLSSAPLATWERLKEALHAHDVDDCGLIRSETFIRVLEEMDLGLTETENEELKQKYRRGDEILYRDFLDNISAILHKEAQHVGLQQKSGIRKSVPKILSKSTQRNSRGTILRQETLSSEDSMLIAIREKILVAWNKWKVENESRHKGFSRMISFKKDHLTAPTRVDPSVNPQHKISEDDLSLQLSMQRLFQTFQSILTASEFERIFHQYEQCNLLAAGASDRQTWSQFLLDFIMQKPSSKRDNNNVLPLMQTLRSQSVPLLARRTKARETEEALKNSRWRPASVADMADVAAVSTPNLPPPSAAWRGKVRLM